MASDSKIVKSLNRLYESATGGGFGLSSAEDLATEYRDEYGSIEEAIDALIYWESAKCGASGFLTNLGGLPTLPVTIPVEMASTCIIQMRMAAAIAYLRGFDLSSDRVRTFVLVTLLGDFAKELLKDLGVRIARAALNKLTKKLSAKLTKAIGKAFLVKAGEQSALSMIKFVPLVSGMFSGSIDTFACFEVGRAAKYVFKKRKRQMCVRIAS